MDIDSTDIELFENIFDHLCINELGPSIRMARAFVDTHPLMMYKDALENIENDYALMLSYMKKGMKDPKRDQVYESLINRLYNFVSDLYLTYKIKNTSFFTEAEKKSSKQSFSNDNIKQMLEGFVTDLALLSLDIGEQTKEKAKNIYSEHSNFIQALFNHIIVSRQWTESDRKFFEKLILSPTVDIIDSCQIISAITLAVMNNMDINKFTVLMDVYLKAKNENLRQRALVGWVFALSSDMRIHDRFESLVVSSLEDEKVQNELLDLQKQILFCVNTERDNDKIQKDIMPEIIKNNNINITRFGITEKEEDPMNDVFDPGESDRQMEKMEECFQKMVDMQKEGSDIYFGGFSQMKNFPFFYNLANWFCPFYADHPAISNSKEKIKNTSLIENIIENGPFCDSDKFSFVLVVSSLLNRLPENMREMLSSGETMVSAFTKEDMKSPTYIRRMILQDMYRFFRLYPRREELVDPFDITNFIFITDEVFASTNLYNTIPDLLVFALKHKNKEALSHLLSKYYDEKDPKTLFVHGYYELNYNNDPYSAVKFFETLTEIEPENKRALELLARSYFETEDYEDAAECYEELCEIDPDNNTTLLNYCVVLTKIKQYEHAVNLLYKINLQIPDSLRVIRVLAWALMGEGKLSQAEKEYSRLLKSKKVVAQDWLNAGYCQWFLGNIDNAVDMFKNFVSKTKKEKKQELESIAEEFLKDIDFITEHNISTTDCHLMVDLVREKEDDDFKDLL